MLSSKQKRALAYLDRAGVPKTMENVENAIRITQNILGTNSAKRKSCEQPYKQPSLERATASYSKFEDALLVRGPEDWFPRARVEWESDVRKGEIPLDAARAGTEKSTYEMLTKEQKDAVCAFYRLLRSNCRGMR